MAEHPPSARHPSSAALQFQFYGAFPSCSTVCHCPVSLSCLTQVGADSLLGDQMRLVSLESTEEGACFTVAGQTMESSHRPAADFTFRVTKDGTPAPRNSMHRGPSAPRPPGAQVHTVPRSLEDQGL